MLSHTPRPLFEEEMGEMKLSEPEWQNLERKNLSGSRRVTCCDWSIIIIIIMNT